MSNDRPIPTDEQIDEAAALLDAGELVAFPTETVYGLGGDAQNPAAVARIYAAKGRPANHPVIVHLAPGSDPGYWVDSLPADAQKLIDAFWPGPLTLILKRAARIPDAVSGGQDSVGLRCPSHPVAQALLRAFDARRGGHGGVAAPSANRFGHVSPTTAQHVRDEFGDAVRVLDGGPSDVGIESTILDLSRGFPALLRPGDVSPRQIADVLGVAPRLPDGSDATAPRASGTLKAHYAPRTPLALAAFERLEPLLAAARDAGKPVALVARVSRAGAWAHAQGVHFVAAPEDPRVYARELYGLLRALDRAQVARILVEKLPDTVEWIAVNDRLGRAAAAFDAQE
ncbi:L-threonylcarbamoyladenylate synthase [Burkholderia thailandensis]|uniref:Threonylcarbamoyl-AMP synthase n=1 Tax=Burkholderia thailandensis (strain ATCC 700388 / DSM 13276 / CCUG 48851 / CIP 106301 / E264) TaxID=271848 RepID=Q2T0S4_BURTA|nr:L-threonylcarbamoyladenylate synthase [Burkholderia thailandensis]ABC36970.1 Sua5/YciO/YrdC/YwlC family protein [Burkholderia thailandensis E264]AHI71920.1 telomere recombination family protein [Burkholderia thailandensis 2002721723]AHI77635.1 telomere recombination family protein [Burkholderia thailandensis E444]AIC86977.1 telomere recombination family protein [Burkholderia thailandensis USAMRU Malaysia \